MDTKPQERKVLTAGEVGAQLGIAACTVLELAKEKKIPCIRIGYRTIRFTQEAIDKFIEEWQNPDKVVPAFEEE